MNSIVSGDVRIPDEAIAFAKAVSALAEQYNVRDATLEMRLDNRGHSPIDRIEKMTVYLSRVDGRGRSRLQLSVSADVKIHQRIENEPDSMN